MSGLVPIAVFIDLYDPKTNDIEERFQNADPINAISFTSPITGFGTGAYKYLSFLYSGATQTKVEIILKRLWSWQIQVR